MVQGIMSATQGLPLANFITAFDQSNISGKVIVMILVLGSIVAWSTMLYKYIHLRSVKERCERFLKEYHSAEHPAALFNKVQANRHNDTPVREIYFKSCKVLGGILDASDQSSVDLFSSPRVPRVNVSDRMVEAVRSAADRSVATEVLLLENGMDVLAIAGSAAPFMGLLGTVLGVMNSFENMGGASAALLSEVAPGISAALLTTVVGLIVALPSSIGYNLLSSRVRHLTVMMDNFAQELISDIERMYIS